MQVTSIFAANTHIPKNFTGEGADESLPLHIDGIPPEAKTVAVIMDDPDAPVAMYLFGTAPIPDVTYAKLTRLTELGEETAVFEVPPGTLPAP